jgi:hypothetical protein
VNYLRDSDFVAAGAPPTREGRCGVERATFVMLYGPHLGRRRMPDRSETSTDAVSPAVPRLPGTAPAVCR